MAYARLKFRSFFCRKMRMKKKTHTHSSCNKSSTIVGKNCIDKNNFNAYGFWLICWFHSHRRRSSWRLLNWCKQYNTNQLWNFLRTEITNRLPVFFFLQVQLNVKMEILRIFSIRIHQLNVFFVFSALGKKIGKNLWCNWVQFTHK